MFHLINSLFMPLFLLRITALPILMATISGPLYQLQEGYFFEPLLGDIRLCDIIHNSLRLYCFRFEQLKAVLF